MKIFQAFAILLSVAVPVVSLAQEKQEDTVQTISDTERVYRWLLRQMASRAPVDLAAAEIHMRSTYVLLSMQAPSENPRPRMRAQIIAKILEKDLDNDGTVTSAELRESFEAQARRPLSAAAGIRVAPTAEQVEAVLQQMISGELAIDKNGDGAIDFAEMRRHADEKLSKNPQIESRLTLSNPAIIAELDTSGDKIISEAEFLAGVRKAFEIGDANKDGTITREELPPRLGPLRTAF